MITRAAAPEASGRSAVPAHHMSDGGQIVTLANPRTTAEKQTLYASDRVVEEANLALEDAASLIRLEIVSNASGTENVSGWWSREGDCWLWPVWPKWVKETERSHHVALNAPNAAKYTKSWSDCHRTGQTVMGAKNIGRPSSEPERPMVRLSGAKRFMLAPLTGRDGGEFSAVGVKAEVANRTAFAVLHHIARGLGSPDEVPRPTKEDIQAAWNEYLRLTTPSESRTARQCLEWQAEHWISAFIRPDVGEALAIIPCTASSTFSSSPAWSDLKRRVPMRLLTRLGLSDSPPPGYRELVRAIEKLNERLTADEANEFKDAMIRSHMLSKLETHRGEVPDAEAVMGRLRSEQPLVEIIGTLSKPQIIQMVKTETINLNWTGKQRDEYGPANFPEPSPSAAEWLTFFRDTALGTWKEAWNFHWAGVVLKDGHDFVTLENLSVGAEDYPNNLWYFHMYRMLDNVDDYAAHEPETFQGYNMRSGGFGDMALTLCYRFFRPPIAPALTMPRTQPSAIGVSGGRPIGETMATLSLVGSGTSSQPGPTDSTTK